MMKIPVLPSLEKRSYLEDWLCLPLGDGQMRSQVCTVVGVYVCAKCMRRTFYACMHLLGVLLVCSFEICLMCEAKQVVFLPFARAAAGSELAIRMRMFPLMLLFSAQKKKTVSFLGGTTWPGLSILVGVVLEIESDPGTEVGVGKGDASTRSSGQRS